MNQNQPNFSNLAGAAPHVALDVLQARFALRVTAGLSEGSADLGADISERLRFARENALGRARIAHTAQAGPRMGTTRGGAALLGITGPSWWVRIGSVLPAIALVAGLVMIQRWQDNAQISVAAEVDAALLSDDLPPTAYGDAGFAEFLKSPSE